RYVEFIVKSNEKTVVVQQLSFVLKGAINYRIAYARGKDFYPRTDIGENKPGERVEFPIHTTLKPGEQLHIRLFPWNTQSGALTFQLEDCLVKALEIE
ncbi:MAG: rhamnogalacturonan acetylesterase, partial [Phocaeicola sp.]